MVPGPQGPTWPMGMLSCPTPNPHPRTLGSPCSFHSGPGSSTLPSKTIPHPHSRQESLRMSDLQVWGPGRHQALPSPRQQTLVYILAGAGQVCRFLLKGKPLSWENVWACEEQPGHLLAIGSPGGKEHSSGDTRCGPRSQAREAAWDTSPQSLRNQDSGASSLDDGKEQVEWRETKLQGSEQSSPLSLPRPAMFTSSHFPKHFCRTI